MQGLSNGFALLRQHGLKAIVRFAYNYPATETDYLNAKDASLAQVQAHIAQLKPILAANADVIAVWQAGFIGAWGEWHTSSNGLTSDANKLEVRDSLLAALPTNRQLQTRYPDDFLKWFSGAPGVDDILSPSPSAAARIGFHNDCFLASPDDVGTYFADTPEQSSALRQRMQAHSAVTASGGETCLPPVMNQARMRCEDILREGAQYHMAYLNRDYYSGFFTSWQNGACLADVGRKLGYRIALKELQHSASVTPGGTVQVALTAENQGWARVMNDRTLQLRLTPTAGGPSVHLPLASARLLSLGAGQTQQWISTVALPTGLAKGNYRVQIGAPDPAASLQSRTIYTIRFANADAGNTTWDAASGYMSSGTSIDIQ